MTGVTEARAALERGGRVVLVTPPAPLQAPLVWDLLGPGTLIVCADQAGALDWAAAAPAGHAVHPVTGLERTARLLKEGAVGILAGSLADLTALTRRAALKLDAITTVVLAWPEALLPEEPGAPLDALLSETSGARRIVLSWNPARLEGFLERQAHRAPLIGSLPQDDTARPLPSVASARYALVSPRSRGTAVDQVIDALNPPSAYVWSPRGLAPAAGGGITSGTELPATPQDLIVCADLPTRDQLAALARQGPVVLLLTLSQLAYAHSIASGLSAIRLGGGADRAADRMEALRREIAARLEAGDVDAELLALEPLFTRFDPAEVAAALLALRRVDTPAAAQSEGGAPAAWVRLFVNVGKKDRAAAKDLVAVLIREAGVTKTDIGRIELRDTFTTVEVAAGVADAAAKKLTGTSIRGRRLQARRDRTG